MKRVLAALWLLVFALAGCAGVPSSSAPQAIGTVDRPAPPSLPKPVPGMDPDVLLREFLKATADPANRHLAARQFLTESASRAWDDAGSALLIDNVVFVETRGPDRVSVSMRADILGSLSDMGVFETGEGALPDPGPIELVKTSGGWRIDRLPNGVFLDWQQFQSTYKRNTLYFADPTGKTVVPDPRYVAVSDPDLLATELVSKLIAGPRPEMANTVRNLLGPPLKLRGPVTRADGGKMGVGRGYGGARIDLENLSTTDPHSGNCLRHRLIWTLARAGINGPYVINADGAALDDRFADGWNTSDVAATDPGAADGAAAGLHALMGGSLVSLDGQRATRGGRLVRPDAQPDGGGRVAHRPGGGVDRDAAPRCARHGVVAVGRPARWQCDHRRWTGRSLSRPTWSLDDAIWVVVDGNNVVRAIQDASGQPGPHPRRLHGGVDPVPRRDRRACSCPATAHARRW